MPDRIARSRLTILKWDQFDSDDQHWTTLPSAFPPKGRSVADAERGRCPASSTNTLRAVQFVDEVPITAGAHDGPSPVQGHDAFGPQTSALTRLSTPVQGLRVTTSSPSPLGTSNPER